MLKRLEALFDNMTSLKAEDMIPNEEILFSTYSVWFSEFTMLVVTGLAIVVSLGLFVYGFLTNISGIWSTLLYAFALITLSAGVIFSVSLLMNHYSKRYFITNFRLIKRTGLFSKKLIYVQYDKIQNVRISKSIGERMVDMGDIYIDTAGGDEVEMVILDIPDPEKMHRMILQGMERQKIGS
jgi:uncharacterized membrane protein YdbT with pleckstrin-like domain